MPSPIKGLKSLEIKRWLRNLLPPSRPSGWQPALAGLPIIHGQPEIKRIDPQILLQNSSEPDPNNIDILPGSPLPSPQETTKAQININKVVVKSAKLLNHKRSAVIIAATGIATGTAALFASYYVPISGLSFVDRVPVNFFFHFHIYVSLWAEGWLIAGGVGLATMLGSALIGLTTHLARAKNIKAQIVKLYNDPDQSQALCNAIVALKDLARDKINAILPQPENINWQPNIEKAIASLGEAATIVYNPSEAPKPDVPPEAASLLKQIKQSHQTLLFTRNISLRELKDISKHNSLRREWDSGTKYFRNGQSHEYGAPGEVITLVMKKGFHQSEVSQKSRLVNMYIEEIDGNKAPGRKIKPLGSFGDDKGSLNCRVHIDGVIEEAEQEGMLLSLAEKVDYNRCLEARAPIPLLDNTPKDPDDPLAAATVLHDDAPKFMGYYPQLEVNHDIPLDQVERILVPEHMLNDAIEACRQNHQLLGLLQKVEGTGQTKEEFLHHRNLLFRRSRAYGGQFTPNFGFNSFFLFEQAFFRLCLEENHFNPITQIIVSQDTKSIISSKNGFRPQPAGPWIFASPQNAPEIERTSNNDWKVFINPRPENFDVVLKKVVKILNGFQSHGLGFQFKIAANLNHEWRAGRPFGASSSPKIIIYANEKHLQPLALALDAALKKKHARAGFDNQPGPSFCRRYGKTDLIFYKKEYFEPWGEARVAIAAAAEQAARQAGITDEAEIMAKKQAALEIEYEGENYYMRKGDTDPLVA